MPTNTADQPHDSRTLAVQMGSDDAVDWVMGPPVITLYATKAEATESEGAFLCLQSLGLGFDVEPSGSSDVQVGFGGRLYHGLSAVERLTDVLRQFRATLPASDPVFDAEVAARARPDVRRRALKAVERQVDVARQSLSRILA